MNYSEIKTLKGQVQHVLEHHAETRNSDIALTIKIWQLFYAQRLIDNATAVKLTELYELPREDNVKRVRAHFQNDQKQYLPTDEKVAIQRGLNMDEWRVAMGYKTTQQTFTPPSKLNEPVITKIKGETWPYQIYEITDWGTSIECSCPAFKFKHSCKHVAKRLRQIQLSLSPQLF